jgi:hypothetical protein
MKRVECATRALAYYCILLRLTLHFLLFVDSMYFVAILHDPIRNCMT